MSEEAKFALGFEPARVLYDCFPDDPAPDAAVSRATMRLVAAGASPRRCGSRARRRSSRSRSATSWRTGTPMRWRRRGRRASAPSCAWRAGAAVFHGGTLEVASSPRPTRGPASGVRFEATANLLARALRRLGADARVGGGTGRVLPRALERQRGRGAQRRASASAWSRAVHVGSVVVAEDGAAVRRARARLPGTGASTGTRRRSAPTRSPAAASGRGVRDAVLAEYAERFELMGPNTATLELARELALEHRPPEPTSV